MNEGHGAVLRHEEIYKGRVFAVVRDRVRLPQGVEATLEVVRHPGSVVLLPMPDPDHVILVKQYRYAVDRWVWELAAAEIQFLGAFYPTPGYCDETMNFFRLTGLAAPAGRPPASPDHDEDIRTQRFSLDEVRRMIRDGGIVDLKTVAGIALL
jgi:hypothetical protein